MAISDLCNELKENRVLINEATEGRIVNAVLQRLETDKQTDVQSISVKW